MGVARRSAEPEHRVLLVGLEVGAAQEAGVLVGLEVRHPDDDRLGPEGSGDGADPLRQSLNDIRSPVGIAPQQLPDPRSDALVADALGVERRHG